MKQSFFIFLLLSLLCTGCRDENENENEEDVFTREAIVSFSEECGYLIHIYTGKEGHFHAMIYIPDNLPKEYQIDKLKVTVTYRSMEEMWYCKNGEGLLHGINLIKIQKR
jgi:hypothetical protein